MPYKEVEFLILHLSDFHPQCKLTVSIVLKSSCPSFMMSHCYECQTDWQLLPISSPSLMESFCTVNTRFHQQLRQILTNHRYHIQRSKLKSSKSAYSLIFLLFMSKIWFLWALYSEPLPVFFVIEWSKSF